MDVGTYQFIVKYTGQPHAVHQFTTLIACLHKHQDWTALNTFFSKRYDVEKSEHAQTIASKTGGQIKIPVDMETASVGLPADFFQILEIGASEALNATGGGDPLRASVGPAIGMGIGMQVMDLCYIGKDPRGRTFNDWANLWKAIEGWVRQYEASKATAGFISYSVKGLPAGERLNPFLGVKPEYIWTRAVQGANGVAHAFSQIAASPAKFRDWELDYLTLMAPAELRALHEERFPANGVFDVYSGPKAKECPTTMKGDDWEAWAKTIQLGQILVPKTPFQARWALLVAGSVGLKLIVKQKSESWDQCGSAAVYL